MESFPRIVRQIVLCVFSPLLGACVLAWVLLQLQSFKSRMWSKLGRSVCAGLVSLAIACTALIGKNTNGVNGVGGMFLMQFNPPAVLSVTPEDISNGWRVAEVSGTGAFTPPPANAVTNERWRLRGAHDDAFRIPANGWSYPFASGVTVLSRGEIRKDIRSRDFPRAFEQDLSLLPVVNWQLLPDGRNESVFWHGATPSNTLLVTWWNAALGREATNPVCFQAELYTNGGFDYRYEDRTVRHVRVWPFDLDDDGLENSVDPDPLVAGPDAHGTNAEWYNTVCSNVLEAVASGSTGTTGILPVGNGSTGTTGILPVDDDCVLSWRADVNSNAYYFVDVIAERGPAPIYFTGDRDSRLGSPVVVALAGVTNRVPLLIGVDYAVTSDTPFTVSFPIDYIHPTVSTNGVADYNVRWPLDFVFTESIGESNRVYTATVEPYDPGGAFTSDPPLRGAPCGCVSFSGNTIVFGCSPTCDCGGVCKKGILYYLLGGAAFASTGGVCRCGFDDPAPPDPISYDPTDMPSLSITFSKQAVVFDDECEIGMYDVKPKSSTRVRISVDAYGGTRGGELVFSSMNLGKLTPVDGSVTLPPSRTLAEQEAFHTTGVYEGAEASDAEGDVSISGTFTELVTGQQISDSNSLTVVRVEIKEVKRAPGNPYVHRRCYGIAEEVECKQFPSAPSVLWRTNGNGTFSLGITKIFCCPLTAERCQLYAECKSAPLPIILRVIEPERIGCDYAEFLPPTSDGRGCGMLLYLQLFPLSVSFSGLEIQEIPADLTNWQQWGSHSGYFDDYAFYQRWCHTTLWGAGVWHAVNEFNGIEFDESRIWTWPQPWSEGTLSWTIPYGWRLAGSTFNAPVGQINPPSYSVWTMSSNFIEKTKHSHTIGVSANGQMYLDGSLRNGNP